MAKNKRPWFGKRWTLSFITWLDAVIFGRSANSDYLTMAPSFCACFSIGLIAGFVMVPLSLIFKQETVMTYLIPGAGLCALLWSGYYLYNNLGAFSSIWVKIFRSLFVVVLNLVICAVALYIGMWAALIVVAVLIGWFFLNLWAGDSNPKKKVRLENGEELTVTKGACGEDLYNDDSGASWYRVGNTFTKF